MVRNVGRWNRTGDSPFAFYRADKQGRSDIAPFPASDRYNPGVHEAGDRLWTIAHHNGGVNARELLRALGDRDLPSDPNPRTPLLVRDSLRALELKWGRATLLNRLTNLCDTERLFDYSRSAGDDHGFPSLERRTMNATERDDILALFRELGDRITRPATLIVGGSTALILNSLIVHETEDIDVVNEVPEVIRTDFALLESLKNRFPLQLTHFQSHYLPQGWDARTHSLGVFNQLTVRVVDAMDVLTGKVFSRRDKDYVHVAEAWKQIDRAAFRDRLATSTANLRQDASSLAAAKHNWYVLTGDAELP